MRDSIERIRQSHQPNTARAPVSRPNKKDFKAYFEGSPQEEKRLEQLLEMIPPETLIQLKNCIAADKEPVETVQLEGAAGNSPYVAQFPSYGSTSIQCTLVRLSPEIQDLYENMVDALTHISNSSQSQTTVSLQSPQFASSPFYGAEIIIEEFTHLAPKSYNIQLIASPQALEMMQANMQDLMAAFQNSNYNFKVNRLEMSVQSHDPARPTSKGPVSRDKEEQEHSNE